MCRSPDGFVYSHRDRLKINAFYLRLSISKPQTQNLPETITLHYLPRISGTPLEINDTKIRPDLPAFVTLHRLISAENNCEESTPAYASRERVRVGEAVRFEVYVREDKLLKGIFRKDEEDEWKIDCESAVEGVSDVKEVEISVAAEGLGAIVERVDTGKRRRRRRRRCSSRISGVQGLELDDIPEESEEGFCDCCCDEVERKSDGEDDGEDVEMMDMEVDGMRWAVDVGIWVMCFGVGYLVSKASSRSLRRRKGMIL